MKYDILIRSGTVLDGISDKPLIADIGVKGDSIAEVGDLGNEEATLFIDAKGKYVAPGFIDLTNHSDTYLSLFQYPYFESMAMQGVTTAIGGNCGSSLAPLGSRRAINAVAKWTDPAQINLNWDTVEEFFTEVERVGIGINFGMFAGYGTLRRSIIGDQTRIFNKEEIKQAQLLLDDALSQGVFGLSLGLTYGHERVSPTEEIIEIARPLIAKKGIVKIHLRSEGSKIFAAVNEAVQIGRELNVPIQISHLKVIGKKSWSLFEHALKLIQQARESGVDIHFDTTTYRSTGSPLYLLLPEWTREGGFQGLFKRLRNPVERQKIVEALQEYTLHYHNILVIAAKTKMIVGKTLAEVAKGGGMSNEKAMLEALLANNGRITIIGRTISRENTERAVKDPNSFIASDGAGYSMDAIATGDLVHPRSFGNFARFWHRYVVEKEQIPPHVAIKKLTSGPAEKIGLRDRGALKKGFKADIVIFDIHHFKDEATYRIPFRYASGMDWVIVNGTPVVEKGIPAKKKVGKILRKAGT